MKTSSLFLFLGLTLTAMPVFANSDQSMDQNASTTTAAQPDTAQAQQKDAAVLNAIMAIDNDEITLGNDALKNALNADVKDFAQAMISDHTKNLQAAQSLAQKINVTPAAQAKPDQKMQELSAMSGSEFDVAYINAMVVGHEKALAMIKASLSKVSNSDLTSFLKDTETAVEHHLEMAKNVQKELAEKKST